MTSKEKYDAIRGDTLNSMARTESMFTLMLVLCGIAEAVGIGAVLWLMDWSDSTHRLIFAATMLLWVNLALWVAALAVKSRVGEHRILRAIEILAEAAEEER